MQYARYGTDGPLVSRLGFGVMRLPCRKGGKWGNVHFGKSGEVLRAALEAGVNFFDSHHDYHGGLSEVAIGRALKRWKGQRVYIQTKTPMYRGEPLAWYKRRLQEALEKCGVDRIDFLLSHSMNMENFTKQGRKFRKLCDWAIKKGYIGACGFSSHDTPENVKTFIDTGEFSVMLLSYNWLNRTMADTIAYGADHGMGVAVMNPVGGGMLSEDSPRVRGLLRGAKTSPEIGLRYALATPGVTVALSGMSAVEQVAENARTASREAPMTARQWETMNARLDRIQEKARHICTACGYCMPCPSGVDIPGNFRLLNQAKFFGMVEGAKRVFERLRKHPAGDQSAWACKRCGLCLPKCPNHVPVMEQLAETAALLGE